LVKNRKRHSTTLDWEDVRFFTVLARRRTLAASARALEVTLAQVSRRLTNLEATLGVRLFTRRARGFSLNAEGAMTLAEAAQMEMAACSLLFRSRVAAGTTGARVRARRSSRRATGVHRRKVKTPGSEFR
jgi:DNA-binding transcriptional LysR family regulator